MSSDDNCREYEENSNSPLRFNQSKLNDVVQDIYLSKDQSEIIAWKLQEKNILNSLANVTLYRTKECRFLYFSPKEDYLVFWNDIAGRLGFMGQHTLVKIDDYLQIAPMQV